MAEAEDEKERPEQGEAGSEEQGGERPTYVAVRCKSCGAGFRARRWREGIACPNCGSASVERIPAPGGAVDYALADRSHGTTASDVMFAQWALWCGHITPHQYDVAVHRQNSELQEQGVARPIHEVMISLGFLDEEVAGRLLKFLTVRRPNENDEDFLRRLLARGRVEEQKVRAVSKLQQEMAQKRNEVPPIGQLLLRKRVITEAEMLEILNEQAREGRGALRVALGSEVAWQERPEAVAAVEALGPPPRNLGKIVLLVLLSLLAAGAWAWQLKSPRPAVWIRCQGCGRLGKVAWPKSPKDWPVECPYCHQRKAYFAVKCRNGHIFARRSPYSHERCPICGSDYARPLTDADVRAARHGQE